MTSLHSLLRSVAREQDEYCGSSSARARARERLFDKPLGPTTHRRSGLVASLAVAAVLVLGLGVNHLRLSNAEARLVARDLNGIVVEGSWVSALRGEEHPLRFSDGSSVALSPLSQARLVRLTPHGAEVFLETGMANVSVTHRPKAQWKISAGPFTVQVTGTRFDVRWSPVQDRFELELAEGSVVVSGCGFGNGRNVESGQRVFGSCKAGRAEVTRVDVEVASASAPSVALPRAEPSGNRLCETTLPHLSSSTRPAIKGVAPSRSLPSSNMPMDLETAAAKELLELGNLVRQDGNLGRAKGILGTLRRRFPRSSEAGQAAFALGLIDFDGFAAYKSAADWFRTYLAEQPSGTLAREAKGRLMEALYRASSPDARAAAEAYLAHHPTGPHSELAQRILKQQ